MISNRENFLRTVKFRNPQWIPSQVHINGAEWAAFKKDIEDVVLRHPTLFPSYFKGRIKFNEMNYDLDHVNMNEIVDQWGCTWIYPITGLDGVNIRHPLENLDDFESYVPPVPKFNVNTVEEWKTEIDYVQRLKEKGELAAASTDHGILFMRLTYLRGFENALIDFATEEPKLQPMIDMITDYYMKIVEFHIRRRVDLLTFAEDLGTQESTIISPKDFKKWIAPAYKKLMDPCRANGILIGLHSDGKTLDILEDQIAAGVDIVNPQDLCNGIDNLARRIKGKACIELDIDRQSVVPFGTRKDIDDLIKEETMKLGSKNGGLTFVVGIYPPTPPENLDAVCCALEKYRTWWWD